MRIELLYFEGCPSYKRLLARVAELAPGEPVELQRIDSERQAIEQRFLGSPTLRVEGRDVEPGAEECRDFGLSCRLYRTGPQLLPVPPDDWITAAIQRARGSETRE
jgi:hypothetical protein